MMVHGLFSACNSNNARLTRISSIVNKEVYYGQASEWVTQDTLTQYALDFNKAFALSPIQQSSSGIEIRIYYRGAFCERFFIQTFNGESSYITLLNCGGKRRNDSLFMKTGNIIQATAGTNQLMIAYLDSLPSSLIWEDKVEDVLDAANTYFIELKQGPIIKRILIANPFDKEMIDDNGRHISQFLKNISTTYSFRFFDGWNKIDSLAFRNN
ncbi:MAG: hypothetical protein V4722_08060 [Bacteroidota bacterium]